MPAGRFGRLDESWPMVIQFNQIAHISKIENSNLINLKTFPNWFKEIDTSIRSNTVDCVYIAVYISLLQ